MLQSSFVNPKYINVHSNAKSTAGTGLLTFFNSLISSLLNSLIAFSDAKSAGFALFNKLSASSLSF